jgi:hypothetical protein
MKAYNLEVTADSDLNLVFITQTNCDQGQSVRIHKDQVELLVKWLLGAVKEMEG